MNTPRIYESDSLTFARAVRIASEHYGIDTTVAPIYKMWQEACRREYEDGEENADSIFRELCDRYDET